MTNFFATLKELHHASDFEAAQLCPDCHRTQQSCDTCKSLLGQQHLDALRDRIVTGIASNETRHKLLSERDLTLEKAVTICRSEEAARETQKDMSTDPATRQIKAFRRKSQYKATKNETAKKNQTVASADMQNLQTTCQQCGYNEHKNRTCPAATRQCSRCGKTGHFAKMCQTRQPSEKGKLGRLKLQRVVAQTADTVPVTVDPIGMGCTREILWFPDTGSDVDAISKATMEELCLTTSDLLHDDASVISANGNHLDSLGKIPVIMRCHGEEVRNDIHVYEDLVGPLMSKATLKALGFLPQDWPVMASLSSSMGIPHSPTESDINAMRDQLKKEFSDVFRSDDLPPMDGAPVEIRLKAGANPFRVVPMNAPRNIPYAYRQQVKDQLDEMVRKGIIEAVTEPSESWCHPIVVVPKKTPGEVRMTVDLTKLNKQVDRPTHPTRTVKDTISNIAGAKYFTTFDARHGYWQVPLGYYQSATRPRF